MCNGALRKGLILFDFLIEHKFWRDWVQSRRCTALDSARRA